MVRREITGSHTLAKTANIEEKQEDEFCNATLVEGDNLGASEVHCKTDIGLGPNLKAAIEWLAVHRDEIDGAPVPYVRESFGLSNLEAIEALKRGRALRNARAL